MKVKLNAALSGWLKTFAVCVMLLLAALALAACGQAATPAPEAATETSAPLPTETQLPSATPTEAATATLEPTATATATLPPTATQVPPLAVLTEDGFDAWCMPVDTAVNVSAGAEAPASARKLTVNGKTLQVPIPASYCTLAFNFNQPVPEGAQVNFYDGNTAFLKLPLKPTDGKPDRGWVTVTHTYVVNPPYWAVTYRVTVTGADGKELWSNPVVFAKPTPEGCPFGGLPDPVTMYCTITDPWEIEPHPDTTYPYDHNKFLTPQP